MDLRLNKNDTTPLYLQVKNSIRLKIITKELQPGFKLPPERQLAQNLAIHRNTIIKAYSLLVEEGLVISSHTSPRGYFVCENNYEIPQGIQKRSLFSPLDVATRHEFLNAQNVFRHFYCASVENEAIPFAGMVLNPETLPSVSLKNILQEIIESDEIEPYWYCSSQGLKRLRESIVRILFQRNIYVRAANIQIISETFDAINTITEMYMEKGDCVIMEEPACPAIVNIFISAGVQVVFVPLDQDGIRIDILREMIQKHRPKLIYTLSTNHNPTAITMSLDRRHEFLHCIQEFSIPVIEEDSQSEFNFTGTVLPSLYSMDTTDSVIYIDSAGLTFFPGARLGYVVAPDSVIETYSRIVHENELFISSFTQALWSRFIDEGYYDQHKAFLVDYYRKKRDLLCAELQKIPEISFEVPPGGLAVWCRLPDDVNERALTNYAEKKGVLLMPGFTFYPYGGTGDGYLRLCFSGPSDEEIVRGTAILRDAIENSRIH